MRASPDEAASLWLRPERAEDGPFLAALFAANTAPTLALSGASDALMEYLVAMQFRAQVDSYRVRFPAGRRLILESGDRPAGQMFITTEAEDLYVVEIAVHPDVQGRGFGGAAVAAVQRDAEAAGLGVRALVAFDNGPSLALFRRCGFAETGRTAGVSLELRWTP